MTSKVPPMSQKDRLYSFKIRILYARAFEYCPSIRVSAQILKSTQITEGCIWKNKRSRSIGTWSKDAGMLSWTLTSNQLRRIKKSSPKVKLSVYATENQDWKKPADKKMKAEPSILKSIGWFFIDLRTPNTPLKWYTLLNARTKGEVKLKTEIAEAPKLERNADQEGLSISTSTIQPSSSTSVTISTPLHNPKHELTSIHRREIYEADYLPLGSQEDPCFYILSITLEPNVSISEIPKEMMIAVDPKEGYWFSYSILNTFIQTKVFREAVEPKFEMIKDVFKLKTNIRDLHDFFKNEREIKIYLCRLDEVIGTVYVPLKKIVDFTEQIQQKDFDHCVITNRFPVFEKVSRIPMETMRSYKGLHVTIEVTKLAVEEEQERTKEPKPEIISEKNSGVPHEVRNIGVKIQYVKIPYSVASSVLVDEKHLLTMVDISLNGTTIQHTLINATCSYSEETEHISFKFDVPHTQQHIFQSRILNPSSENKYDLRVSFSSKHSKTYIGAMNLDVSDILTRFEDTDTIDVAIQGPLDSPIGTVGIQVLMKSREDVEDFPVSPPPSFFSGIESKGEETLVAKDSMQRNEIVDGKSTSEEKNEHQTDVYDDGFVDEDKSFIQPEIKEPAGCMEISDEGKSAENAEGSTERESGIESTKKPLKECYKEKRESAEQMKDLFPSSKTVEDLQRELKEQAMISYIEQEKKLNRLRDKFVEERSEWNLARTTERQEWIKKMESLEKIRMNELEKEWSVREEDMQKALLSAKREYEILERTLAKELAEVRVKERKLMALEEESERKRILQEEDLQVLRKRLEQESKHAVRLSEQRVEELQHQRTHLEGRLKKTESRLKQVEDEFSEYRAQQKLTSEAKLKDEVATMRGKVMELEKLLERERELTKAVRLERDRAAERAIRLAHALDKERKTQEKSTIEEVEKLRLKYIAREERYILDGDREELNAIRRELDQLRQVSFKGGDGGLFHSNSRLREPMSEPAPPPPSSIPSSAGRTTSQHRSSGSVSPQNTPLSKEYRQSVKNIRGWTEQRERLLTSGGMHPNEYIILELERRIHMENAKLDQMSMSGV